MKNTPATEILFLLDRSGSMAPLIDDAVGGFNSFLETRQRDPAPSRMTLVLFDDRYEVPHASVPVTHIPPLTNGTFLPREAPPCLTPSDAASAIWKTACGRRRRIPFRTGSSPQS